MKKVLLAVFATLWMLIALGDGLVAQENIAVWKFPQNVTDATCVSSLINATDCDLYTEGAVSAIGTNNPNTILCDNTDNTKSLQVTGLSGGAVVFKISTLPFVNIGVSYDIRCHPSMAGGYPNYVWSYSFNGVDFTEAPQTTAVTGFTSTTYETKTADFSSVSALNCKSEVWLKLTMSGAESANYSSNVDNVVFTGTPSNCMNPVDLVVSSVTRYSAVVSWSHGGGNDAVSYSVFISTDPDATPTEETTVSGTQKTFTSLTPGTTYYVYVKTNCDVAVSSGWASTSFTTCYVPTGISVYNVTDSSADISWTDAVNTQWQVCVTSSTVDWTNAVVVDVPSYHVTDLSLNTVYNVYVRAYCPSCDCSPDAPGTTINTSFRTAFAENVTDLIIGTETSEGYVAPFENLWKISWTQSIYDVEEIGGAGTIGSVAWFSTTSNSVHYSDLRIYMGETSMSAVSSYSSWVPMSSLTLVYSSSDYTAGGSVGWESFLLDQPFVYSGQGNLVIVVAKNTLPGDYNASVKYRYTTKTNSVLYRYSDTDNSCAQHPGANTGSISDELPNIKLAVGDFHEICMPVTALSVRSVGSDGATLVWRSRPSVSSWAVRYGVSGFNVETSGTDIIVNDTSVVLSGLSVATSYDVYVKSVCDAGNNEESGWKFISFTTECAAIDMPYSANFDEYTPTSYSSAGVMPLCWSYVFDGQASYAPHVSNSAPISGNGLVMNANSSYDAIVILPEFIGNLNEAIVRFDAIYSSSSYGILNFGYYMEGENGGFVFLQQLESSTSVVENVIDLSNEPAFPAGARLALQYTNSYSGMYYVSIDNLLVVRPASCGYVSEVSLSSVTNSTASITWEAVGNATQWQVMINGETYNVNDNSYLITGLSGSTTYHVYVRAACGNNEYSDYTETSFTTTCNPITVNASNQFDEDFEDVNEYSIPECWTRYVTNPMTTYEYPCVLNNSYYSNSGVKSLRMYTYYGTNDIENIIAMPPMSGINTLQLAFSARFYSTKPQYFEVGYIRNGEFVALDNITDLTTEYQRYEIYFHEAPDDAEAIAFRTYHTYSSSYVNIDDINVTDLPSCIAPYHITLQNILSNSATISWDDVSEASSWQYIVNDGNPQDTDTKPISLTNLTSNTEYTVLIRTDCGNGIYTEWSSIHFSTLCDPIDEFPWVEDFNTLTSGIPSCWNNDEGSINTDSNRWTYSATGHTGAGVVFDSWLNPEGYTNMLKTPVFDLSGISSAKLEFWYKNPTGGNLSIYVSTDGGASFATDAIASGHTGVSEWTKTSYNISSYCGNANVVIAFKGTSNYGSGDAYIYIDDIMVRECSSNTTIISYEASTAQGDALCLINNENHTISAELRFGYAAGEAITAIVGLQDANSTILQQLGNNFVALPSTLAWYMTSIDTTFVYKVIAENGDEQEYIATYRLEACPAPSDMVFEQQSPTSVTLSWSSHEQTSAWDFYISTVPMSPEELNAANYTHLTAATTNVTVDGETTYYWYVRTACNLDNSTWLESSFTSWENCVPPSNVVLELVNDTDIAISWDVQENLPVSEGTISDGFENGVIDGGMFQYINSGVYPWVITASPSNDGSYCIKSSNFNIPSSESMISMTYTAVSDMQLSFKHWVMGESTSSAWDYLIFSLDGNATNYLGRETTGWTTVTHIIPAGTHTMTWTYHKDATLDAPGDCAYIDDITLHGLVPGGSSSVVLYKNSTELVTLSALQTSYTDEGLVPGNYCYSVKTICREGYESVVSDPICQSINSCLAVTNLSVASISTYSAVLTWTRGSSETAWNIIVNGGTPIAIDETTPGVTVNDDEITYSLVDLAPNTNYEVAVQSNCADEVALLPVTVQFTTERVPAELPYTCNFDDAVDNLDWVIENGNQTNKWYIGSAAGNDSPGMYITNNNGTANAYTVTSASYVFAYRSIYFDQASEYVVAFDWKAYGETINDYLRAFLVPANVSIDAGSSYGISANSTPNGWIPLDGSMKLNMQSSWQNVTRTISVDNVGVYKLVFYWANNASGGTQPPAAIDNISIAEVPCPSVLNLEVNQITNNSASITWSERGAAEAWQIVLSPNTLTPTQLNNATPVDLTSTTYNATGLTELTNYHVYVRANCSEDDKSSWAEASFATVSNCPTPTNFVATTITSDIVTVSWEGYHATQWTFEYRESSSSDWIVVGNLTSPMYSFDVEPTTSYSMRVKAVCEGGEETIYATLYVTTPCAIITIDEDNPFTEGFENYNGSSYSSTEGEIPLCWEASTTNTYNIYPHVIGNSPYYYVHDGTKALTFYGSGDCYAVLPEFSNDLNTLAISFWSAMESESYGTLTLGYITAVDNNMDTYTVIETYSSSYQSMVKHTTMLGNVPAEATRLVFRWRYQNQWSCCIDDVVVRVLNNEADILSYALPTQLSAATIDNESATVDITVAYSTDMATLNPLMTVSEGATYVAAEPIAIDSNTTTIAYQVTSEDGLTTRPWTVIVHRTTIASSEKDILSFSIANQVGQSVIDTDNHTVSAVAQWNVNLAGIVPTIIVSPQATINPESGVMQNFTNPVVYTVTAEDGTAMEWTVTVIKDSAACPNPSEITISTLLSNTVTLEWETVYLENSYIVKVSTDMLSNMSQQGDVYDGIVTANTVTVGGLSESTTYYVYLQSDCENASGWVSTTIYTGPCVPEPTMLDGDGITNVTFGANLVVNNNTHPVVEPLYGDYTELVGDVSAGLEATVSITYATGYTYGTVIWVNWNNDLMFSDDEIVYRGESTNASPTTLVATFTVPVSTRPGVYTMRIGGSDMSFDDTDSPSPCLDDSYLIYEDYTLQVIEAPSCLPVEGFAVAEVSAISAIIEWDAGNGQVWDVVCSETPLTDPENADVVSVNNASYEAEGLTANTNYYLYVRADCGDDDYSVWRMFEFQSSCDVFTLPYTEDFETAESFGCWTFVDADGDNYFWRPATEVMTTATYHNGSSNALMSQSYDRSIEVPLVPDNWAISPAIMLPPGLAPTLRFYAAAQDELFPAEHYGVYISTTTNDPSAFTLLFEETMDANGGQHRVQGAWGEKNVDLSAYAGNTVYIAFRHFNCTDEFYLLIDDISITVPGLDVYTIVAAAGPGGSISPSGPVSVYEGTDISFTITPTSGKRVANLFVDGSNAISDLEDGVYTFTNVTAHHNISVIFEEYVIPTYTISATAGANGSITPSGDVTVTEGDDQSFTITPISGYEITSVMVDNVEAIDQLENGVYTFSNVTEDHTIYAIFNEIIPVTHSIFATYGPHGMISPAGLITVIEGRNQTFALMPDEGYHIETLTVDGEDAMIDIFNMTYTFYSVTTMHTIDVTFAPDDAVDEYSVGSLAVYPNPNNGMFSIDFSGLEGEATYQLIDARGAIIETRDISITNGDTMTFDHNLHPGAYFVRIITDDKVYVEQIIVE